MKRHVTRGLRCHIGLYGRRNVGKSSLLNAITGQQVCIVSEEAGTTTDPVEKPMELAPLGPVLFIDTAGIDDAGGLGGLRIEKTRRMIDRTDLGVIVTEGSVWGDFEEWLLAEFRERGVAAIAVFNKIDLIQPVKELIDRLTARGVTVVRTAAVTGYGILDLRRALLNAIPDELINQPELMGGTVGQDEPIVLVVPIDRGAPKGRLILPQVQAIRDILDHDAQCLVVKDTGLRGALARLERPPDLVVTDSQVFAEVAREVPSESRLTSFSILFANWKGDLAELVRGTQAIDRLQPGDRILIAEACTHHPSADDIGRVKIPRWLAAHAGGELVCDHIQGHDFPQDVRPYRLIVHCGACMFNRREVLSRILHCRKFGVPITNYGLTIAYLLGVLRRALEPFPAALAVLEEIDQCV